MAFMRCNCGFTSNQPYYSIRLGHHNINTQSRHPMLAIDSFNVQVYIWRGLRSNQPHSRLFHRRILLSQSCFELTSHSFFSEDGQYLMQRNVSHPNIHRECVDEIISEAMNFARSLLEDPHHFAFYNPSPREIPLVVEVVFENPSVGVHERDLMVPNMRNSVEVPMIPATPKKPAKELLKKVKFEGGDETNNCSICFVEFNEDEEVSATPCQHVYHQECIVKWLETNPTCPLCRHPLSIESN